MSHKVQRLPACFLNSLQRSPGASVLNPSSRLCQQFMPRYNMLYVGLAGV